MASSTSQLNDDEIVKLAHDLPTEENGSVEGGKLIKKTADVKIDEVIDFDSFMLNGPILKGLKRANFIRPSPIQLKAIPSGRIGLDLIVQAKSGTGKTCVFAVLALEIVERGNSAPQVLVLAPTREVAQQIHETLITIGHFLLEKKENDFTGVKAQQGIHVECFIGGTTLQPDKDKAKLQKCQIVVGTPGRIWQLINEGDLSVDSIRLFVLDEADKLMEESYIKDINSIYAHLPSSKQIVVTSATYPREMDEFLSRYMKSATYVKESAGDVQLLGVKQYILTADLVDPREESYRPPVYESWFVKKVETLHRLLSRVRINQCLIFCNYQDKVEELAERLTTLHKWPVACMSAGISQKQRTTILAKFKAASIRLLVSTDLLARGIDAENVNLVINFDVPRDAETYFHRIGRAGRFGGYGAAVTLIMNMTEKWKFEEMSVENDFHVKELPGVNQIPDNLSENEQFFRDLPPLKLPDKDTLRRNMEKRDKRFKQRRDEPNLPKGTAASVDLDEYGKIMQAADPMERWVPTEFVQEGIKFRTPVGIDCGQDHRYSRDEMLAILKDSLSSLPPSPGPIVKTDSASAQSSGREHSPVSMDVPVKGQRLDVNKLMSFFQEKEKVNKEPVTSSTFFPAEVVKELRLILDRDATLDQNQNEGKAIAPIQKSHASSSVQLPVENMVKESAENQIPFAKAPEIKRLNREEILAIQPLCKGESRYGRDYAQKVFNFDKLLDTFVVDPKKKRKKEKVKKATEPPVEAITTVGKPTQIEYDDAILHAAQNPFYRFLGGPALQMQAAAAETRKAARQSHVEQALKLQAAVAETREAMANTMKVAMKVAAETAEVVGQSSGGPSLQLRAVAAEAKKVEAETKKAVEEAKKASEEVVKAVRQLQIDMAIQTEETRILGSRVATRKIAYDRQQMLMIRHAAVRLRLGCSCNERMCTSTFMK